jgi:hypothetical protein
MRHGGRRGSRLWYAEEARPNEGACGVTSALIGIERCEIERRRSRSDADAGGPALGPVLLPWGAECVEEGARERRAEVLEEYVPVLCAFEGVGAGDGPRDARGCCTVAACGLHYRLSAYGSHMS